MASEKDTATFFSKGSSRQFEHVLSLYPEALKLKAERKSKKPEELIKLDNWYQNELPNKIKSRGKDAHLVHDELVQTMKWKLARGKFYPQLSYLIKINTPKAVVNETRRAFRRLPNLEQAITALSNLKGVGTTMASALLAAAAPENAPFMADECLMAIPEIEGIDYTTKEYLNFVQHIRSTVERLNKETNNGSWNPHRVELALWTHYVASELKPSMLDSIPSSTENGDSSPAETKNGDAEEKGEDHCSDDSSQGRNGKLITDQGDSGTDECDPVSTPDAVPPSEETNDSVATFESTDESNTPQSDVKPEPVSPSMRRSEDTNKEEPAPKKMRVD